MLGSKLRSWMEAVRPRKKQQRKEKSLKANLSNPNGTMVPNSQSIYSSQSSENEILDDVNRKSIQTIGSQAPRYSGANLSSPESAYSTGYSTDGTSPGAPPEYYINIRTGTRYFPSESERNQSPKTNYTTVYSNDCPKKISNNQREEHHAAVHFNGDHLTVPIIKETQNYDNNKNASRTNHVPIHPSNNVAVAPKITEIVVNSGLTSPRQRNRIRTNPWLQNNNLSPGNSCVGLHIRQEPKQPYINSPVSTRYLSPKILHSPINRTVTRRESLSSSTCSSNSAESINWDSNLVRRSPRVNSESDGEDDCTLNEMMGKYDESYVYEKETDILSDSDPTDCDTDIDTGQDGGDEDDSLEHEFDFIDNGSYLDFNVDKDIRNTGHCVYYNYEVHRKMSRRKSRKCQKDSQNQPGNLKPSSDRRRRSTSSKRKQKQTETTLKSHSRLTLSQINGSRSAGTTPLSVRRTKQPLSKNVIEEHLKRRSNSVSFCLPSSNAIDQRDKEADKKYKELIVEAEHILMSMKSNGLSPRRVPGPPNKRVELLRNAESAKPDAFIKNRLIEDTSNMHLSRIPSNNFNSPRFSPKKNHITNFINSNSHVLIRRDVEVKGSPLLTSRKELQSCLKPTNSPLTRTKYSHQKSDIKNSPKLKKKLKIKQKQKIDFSDSDDDDDDDDHQYLQSSQLIEFCCPQSEPVKRKVYNNQSKTVAFNLNYDNVSNTSEVPNQNCSKDENKNNSENLRQQVLLNTIASLKRSLEDQSQSLRQVYTSSQNISTYARK